MVTITTWCWWWTIFGFHRWPRPWPVGWPSSIGRIIIGRYPIINVSTKRLSWSWSNQSQRFAGTSIDLSIVVDIESAFSYWNANRVFSFVCSCDPGQKYYQHPMSKSIWFLVKNASLKRKQQQHAKHWIHCINSSCHFGNHLPVAYFK